MEMQNIRSQLNFFQPFELTIRLSDLHHLIFLITDIKLKGLFLCLISLPDGEADPINIRWTQITREKWEI